MPEDIRPTSQAEYYFDLSQQILRAAADNPGQPESVIVRELWSQTEFGRSIIGGQLLRLRYANLLACDRGGLSVTDAGCLALSALETTVSEPF
jgi:hypothetical protein